MSFSAFSQLIYQLDGSNSKLDKVLAMGDYLTQASPADAAWAVFFLSGRRLKRLVSSRVMRAVFLTKSSMPEWLYEEAYMATGDTAETISLLQYQLPNLPDNKAIPLSPLPLHLVMQQMVLPLISQPDMADQLHGIWASSPSFDVLVFNKLISGAFRVGVSQGLLVQALSIAHGIDAGLLQHRLMGQWEPTAAFYQRLILPADHAVDGVSLTHPYPFYLASPLETPADQLADVWPNCADWQLEWKWDGIRAQLIRRQGVTALWSRGEELISERFPELLAFLLPDGCVLDGEILVWQDGQPQPFAQLQQRIGRKTITPQLCEQIPVIFQAYDLLELNGEDIRSWPLQQRRNALETLVHSLDVTHPRLQISPVLTVTDWSDAAEQRLQARERGVEGLMIKHRQSPYKVGRKKGDWWKWKLDPYTADVVLTMAQMGHGRRGDKFTDFTFAIYNEHRELVPIAKAYSGLTNEEIKVLDKWIRQHTLAKFGPVRQVTPLQVFELGFEGIAVSNRHKSGLAVRFPRILRWRQDKPVDEIDTVEQLKALIP